MNKVDSFSLKFYLLPPKAGHDKAKIYLRIIVDRLKAELFTGHSVHLNHWDTVREKSTAKIDIALNEDLAEIKNKIISIKRRLQYEEKPVSAKLLKDVYTGATEVRKFLLEYFSEHIHQIEKLPTEYSEGTVSNYRTTLKHLQSFLVTRKVKDIPIQQVDYKFISAWDLHLMNITNIVHKATMDRNTANKQHQRLKAVLFKAIREDILEKNPYQSFKLKNNKTNRDFLTEEELESLRTHTLGDNKSLQKVRDIFLFSVYTGLRFGDATELKLQHIRKTKEGKVWIDKEQEKTGEMLRVPLLKPAIEIIDIYDNEERKISGYVLPRISHQKVNAYLKVIAELAGIPKVLTHHVARHTFATTITLSNEVPLEVVSKLLGHTSIRATQIYAKITDKYLSKVTNKLDEKYK
jgi:integrase/recombinase XerD